MLGLRRDPSRPVADKGIEDLAEGRESGLELFPEELALICGATQLPRLFLPMKTMVDTELHEGGSTSFTLVFLL
jgi:hypothetical protein